MTADRLAWLTPDGSSPGRPGGSASRRRGRARGRSATGSSRRCSRSSSRTSAGARVLDLFAGSGAGGIEALSRGAASAVFVERDARPSPSSRRNLRATGLGDGEPGRPSSGPTPSAAWAGAGRRALPFDIVIVDPPYADADLRDRVAGGCWALRGAPLAAGARVVVKHFWRDQPPARVGLLASERARRFGETALTFYRRQEGG